MSTRALRSLRAPVIATAMVASQIRIAPMPNSAFARSMRRPTMPSAPKPEPVNSRGPGTNAIQLAIAPKQAKIARPDQVLKHGHPCGASGRRFAIVVGGAEAMHQHGDAAATEGKPGEEHQPVLALPGLTARDHRQRPRERNRRRRRRDIAEQRGQAAQEAGAEARHDRDRGGEIDEAVEDVHRRGV